MIDVRHYRMVAVGWIRCTVFSRTVFRFPRTSLRVRLGGREVSVGRSCTGSDQQENTHAALLFGPVSRDVGRG